MHFAAFAASLFAAAASAAPATVSICQGDVIADGTPFNLHVISSGSELEYAPVSAARRSLLLKLANQDAACASRLQNYATFVMHEGNMFLYSSDELQLFTDRSGMGQGVVQYFDASTSGPTRNGEVTGWEFDANNALTFKGEGWFACPGAIEDSWSMWLRQPSFVNCTSVDLQAVVATDPQECSYTTA